MVNSSSFNGDGDMDTSKEVSAIQAELLQAVLDTEQSAPWLATETAEEYGSRAEAAGAALEISDDEAASGWQALSQQLNQLWGETAEENVSVLSRLQQKFAGRLPSDLLAMIGEKAQQVSKSGQPMVEQLVSCVQDGFTNLATTDLQVMARPMAFAMRGNSADELIEATIQSVRKADWKALSPIEQARLSLAAARYAISRVETDA
ncbi:MAG: hypothetical protein AAFY72_14190 [Cyanobacteria bacterium J06649_4]